MATQEQLRALTPFVLDAQEHCRWHADNDNPSLGTAIVKVEDLLIHDLRGEADDDIDVEDLVDEAAVKVFATFRDFRGATGAELYGWIRKVVVRAIEKIRQRREAQAEDRPYYSPPSAESRAEAARLINLVESREVQPDEAAVRPSGACGGRCARWTSISGGWQGWSCTMSRSVKSRQALGVRWDGCRTFGKAPSMTCGCSLNVAGRGGGRPAPRDASLACLVSRPCSEGACLGAKGQRPQRQ